MNRFANALLVMKPLKPKDFETDPAVQQPGREMADFRITAKIQDLSPNMGLTGRLWDG